jgi:hypothetical protein
MAFSFKQLEDHIEAPLLSAGEQLLHRGYIKGMQQVRSQEWTVQAGAEQVRIKAGKTRVQSLHCSCEAFRQSGLCAHAVAAMLALRKHLQEDLPTAQSIAGNDTKSEVYSVEVLLRQIQPEALEEFVRQYAQRDKGFALALKARFLRPGTPGHAREQVQELLKTAVRANRSTKDQISARSLQNLLALGRQLLRQAEELIAGGDYSEAWGICSALMEHLMPLHQKTEGRSSMLERLAMDLLKLNSVFLEQAIAPVLKNNILLFNLAELEKSVYNQASFRFVWVQRLSEHLQDVRQWKKLEEILVRWLQEARFPGQRAEVFVQWLLVQKQQSPDQVVRTCMEYREEEELLKLSFELALQNKEIKLALDLGEYGLIRNPRRGLQPGLRRQLFELARTQLGNSERTLELASLYYVVSGDTDTLQYLQQAHRHEWPEAASALLLMMEQQDKAQQILPKAGLLLSLKRYPELLELLQQQPLPFEQQARFLSALLPENPDFVYTLLEESAIQYLEQHLGPVPAELIEGLLRDMQQRSFPGEAKRLRQQLLARFPERSSLHERIQPA